MSPVEAWVDKAGSPNGGMIGRLRALVLAAAPGVTEHIKWNAPSFCLAGEDRVTMGIEPKGGVRAILHRGAKVRDAVGFEFADPAGLARWPAPDRGVLTFKNEAEIIERTPALADLFTRWFAATR